MPTTTPGSGGRSRASATTRRVAPETARHQAAPRPSARVSPESTGVRRGYGSLSSTRSQSRYVPERFSTHARRKRSFGILAGIIIVAIVCLLALLWWINRPVPVTINGDQTQVRVNSTLDEVLDGSHLNVRPGDYVSVSDNVIKADQGRRFSAKVNGKKLTWDQMDEFRVEGGEDIEFGNGDNVTEEYTFEAEPILPRLRMEGSGYTIQYVSQWGYAGELQHRVGKDSGHAADVVTKEAQDCVITCIDPYLEGNKKLVALTFDDGPASPYTDDYLKILKKYDVKATFFNLGDNVLQYPEIAQRVVKQGHQLCNHTMAHNQLTSVDNQVVFDEITRSAKVIEEATGVHTTHLRPPYGDFTEQSWLGSGGTVTASIRWTGDSQDWALPGVDAMVSNALMYLHSGSIILMHDGGGDRSQDVDALPKLIEQVQAEGYEFVTVADLMRALGNIPEDICSGTGTMPKDAVWPKEICAEDLAASQSSSTTSTQSTEES